MNLVIGDIRQELGEENAKTLCGIVERRSGKSSVYYILIHTKFDNIQPNVIRSTFMLLSVLPGAKMLGTMCFKVDNRAGTCDKLWVLPLDRPWDFEGENVPEIDRQGHGLSIVQ